MSNATKVGLVTFLALFILLFGLVWKSGLFIRAYGYRLYGNFETISGLLLNAQVRYRGYLVGYVEDIDPNTRGIKVKIIIQKGIVLPANARLRVSFDGLIGEKYMDIIPQEATDEILKPDTVLQGYASKGLVDFVDVGTQNLEQTKKILESLRAIFTSPEVEHSIKDTILRVDTIALRVDSLLKTINQLAGSAEVSGLKSSVKNLNNFITELRTVLLNKNSAEDLRKILANANDTMNNVRISSERFVKLVGNLDTITTEQGTTSDIKAIIEQTRKSVTAVSELLTDPALKSAIGKTSTTIEDTNKILAALNSIKIQPEAEMTYRQQDTTSYYNLGFAVNYAKRYTTSFDFSNRGGSGHLAYFQQGIGLRPELNARVGMLRTLPGVGLDYIPSPGLAFSSDLLYDNAFKMDCRLKYAPFTDNMFSKLYFMLGGESMLQKDFSLIFGVGF